MNYLNLLNQTIDLYVQGQLQEAYDLITQNQYKIKGVDAQLYNFRYAIAAKMGKKDLALRLLKEAVMDKGYWYSQDILLEDDDLAILRQDKTFQEIVQRSYVLEQQAKKSTTFLYEKINDKSDALLLVLHGNQLNNAMAKSEWYEKTLNITFGFLQSDTIEFSDGYCWENFDRGAKKVAEIFQTEKNHHKKIYLGGFSAGAGVLFDSVIQHDMTPDGIFLFAPWLPTIQENVDLIKKVEAKNIKLYILVGDEDTDCLESTKQLVKVLKNQSTDYELEIVKGLNHEYPKNFQKYLKQAIDYFNH